MKKFVLYVSQNYSFAILRPLQKVLEARGDEVSWFVDCANACREYLNPNENCLTAVSQLKQYQADVVFVTANICPTFIPGLKVAVFHGFDAGKLNRRGQNDHFQFRGCFDLYCTQGPNTTEPFKQLQQKHQCFNVIETGWPALDEMYSNREPETAKDKPTILLCSTFSRRLTCAPILFEKIAALSKTGRWNWLVQFHPKMPQPIIQKYKELQSEHLTFVETDNVIPVLQQADVMVCDTSSVLLMFVLQGKPVVTFNNANPKPYMMDIDDPEQLETSIEAALSHPAELMEHITSFSRELHPYTDGKSAQRVIEAVDEVLAGKHPVTASKPLNVIRNFKMRRKLGYWGW